MDQRPPLPPARTRTQSSDSFPAVTPNEREAILQQVRMTEERVLTRLDQVSTQTNERFEEYDRRLISMERAITEFRASAVESERLRDSVDGLAREFREFVRVSHSSERDQERLIADVRVRVEQVAREAATKAAKETAANEGELLSIETMAKSSKTSRITSFVVSVIIGLLGYGASLLRDQKPEPPPPTYPARH